MGWVFRPVGHSAEGKVCCRRGLKCSEQFPVSSLLHRGGHCDPERISYLLRDAS